MRMPQAADSTVRGIPDLVSFLLGTYNAGEHIAQTLDTMLAQTYSPMEIIVVDDGSTDNTLEVLRSYGDRIKVIAQPNGGVSASRNTGLRHARGEFIALMDHDDLCFPERIAMEVAFLRQHPDIGLVSTEFSGFDANGPLAEIYSPYYYTQCNRSKGWPKGHFPEATEFDVGPYLVPPSPTPVMTPVYMGEIYQAMASGNLVHPPTAVFRAHLIEAAGEFDPKAKMMCDWEWLIRMSKVTRFAYIDRPTLNYRRSSFQVSSERYNKTASLDTIYVAERAVALDPDLWKYRRHIFRPHLAITILDAAYANAETRPILALQLLGKAIVRYHWFDGYAFSVLVKALTPNALLRVVRRIRGTHLPR
jgi:glycosyltransferase involved in cell wall biosynthesis